MIAVITIVCVLGLIAVTLRWLVARSQARIVLDHICAACGYIVRGLPGMTCPECGADLSRPGGVLTPRALPPLSRMWLLFLWTVIFGLGFVAMEWAWLSRADEVLMIEPLQRASICGITALHIRYMLFTFTSIT